MYTVTYEKDATKTLRKIPQNEAKRIRAKIKQHAADPTRQRNNVTRLTDHPGYRLRVGNWRVLFLVDDEQRMTVTAIGPRGGIYQ